MPYDFMRILRGESSANSEQYILQPDNLSLQDLIECFKRFGERFSKLMSEEAHTTAPSAIQTPLLLAPDGDQTPEDISRKSVERS